MTFPVTVSATGYVIQRLPPKHQIRELSEHTFRWRPWRPNRRGCCGLRPRRTRRHLRRMPGLPERRRGRSETDWRTHRRSIAMRRTGGRQCELVGRAGRPRRVGGRGGIGWRAEIRRNLVCSARRRLAEDAVCVARILEKGKMFSPDGVPHRKER
jgi:hypothetical protein